MARVGTVLGTMEFGRGPCVGELPRVMVDTFLDFDATYREVDTAYMYTGGESETILGKMDRLKGFIHLQLGFSFYLGET
jgi:aryl-alcohol dehydrogenase-like predicted oxidoreductase